MVRSNLTPMLGIFLGAAIGLALFEFGQLTVDDYVPVLAVLSFLGGVGGGYFVFRQLRILRHLYLGVFTGVSLGLLLFALRLFPMDRFIPLMVASGVIGAAVGIASAILSSRGATSAL